MIDTSVKPIMTVAEFRKLTGSATIGLSGADIAEIINQMHLLARMHIEQSKKAEGGVERLA